MAELPDLGSPSSYLVLGAGAPVYSCDGDELGKVEHVLGDPGLDIFDGLVIDATLLPGGHRFADAEQVEEIFERGVLLKVDRAAAEALPQPAESAAAMSATPDDTAEDELTRKLRRAWELLSGK